jgi:uncharacterized membrane protein YbhN (UPF0104 family)
MVAAAIGAVLLAGVGSAVGWRPIGDVLTGVDVRLAALALALVAVTRGTETVLMTWILRRSGLAIGWGRVLVAKSLGALYGLLLPGDLIGGVAKWSSLAASTGRGSAAFQGVVYNRAVLLVAEVSFGVLALLLRPPWQSHAATAAVASVVAAIVAVIVLAYHPRSGSYLDRRLLSLAERRPFTRARRHLARLLAAAAPFRAFATRHHLAFFAAAGGVVLLRCLVLACWASALGVAVPWLAFIWLRALLGLLRQLPITFGGLGVREATFVVLLAPFGVPAEQAFALGLLVFTGSLLFATLGAVFQVLLAAGVLRWRIEVSPTAPAAGEPAEP